MPAHGDTVRITELGRTNRYVMGAGWATTDVYNPIVIDEISQQLAETGEKVNDVAYKPNIMTSKSSLVSRRPLISIIDDDGRIETKTILKPIAVEKNFKFNSASLVEPLLANDPTYMTFEDLRTLQSDGHEIMSHTMSHRQLGLIQLNELDYELGKSRDILKQEGLNVKSFVYPGGSYVKDNGNENADNSVLNELKAYYESAWVINDGINTEVFDNHKAVRKSFDAVGTLAGIKTAVDEIYANGGWLVLMVHTFFAQWATVEKQQELKDLIDYINTKSIDIVTIDEGLKVYGNVYDMGERNKDHFKIDRFGKVINRYNRWYSLPENKVLFSTPPSSFALNSVTVSTHDSNSTETLFPKAKEGQLITRRASADHTVQEWYPRLFKDVYYERVNDATAYETTWGAFKLRWIKPLIDNLESNALSPTDVTLAQDRTISKSIISLGNPALASFPLGKAGTYTTDFYKSNGYFHEEYEIINTNKKFRRSTKSDGTYNAWDEYCFKSSAQFTATFPTIASMAVATFNVPIASLAITTNHAISLNFRTGLPAGIIYSFTHDATNLIFTLFNASGVSVNIGERYMTVVAVKHDNT